MISVIVVSLIVGIGFGLWGSRYLSSSELVGRNSLNQFVMNNPTTPWQADVQGMVTDLGESAISFQLRTKEGTSKETYIVNLAPKENLIVEKVEIALDATVTISKISYQDLKAGDEVVVTISSDGQNESLTASKITLISSATLSQ